MSSYSDVLDITKEDDNIKKRLIATGNELVSSNNRRKHIAIGVGILLLISSACIVYCYFQFWNSSSQKGSNLKKVEEGT